MGDWEGSLVKGSVRISAEPGVLLGPSEKNTEDDPESGGKGNGLSAELGWEESDVEPEGGGICRCKLGLSPFIRPGSILTET